MRLFATPWSTACQASLSITNSQSLLKLMSIKLVMQSNHLILCHPLLLPTSRSQGPASGSFPMSQFFASGGQSIGASASASVWTTLINNIHQRLMREGTNIRLPKYSIPFDLAPSVASQRNCIIPCLISLLCIWIMGKLNPYPSLLQLLNYSECVQKGPLLSSCLLESNPSVNYT